MDEGISADDRVYDAEAEYQAGSGTWGDILTAVDMLYPIFSITQQIDLQPYMLNLVSLNVNPEDSEISSVFADNNILLAASDLGQYYVPGFGVDQIGEIDLSRGLEVFPSGAGAQTVTTEGLPSELGPIEINPFQVNVIAYLPQDCMSIFDAFAGYEDQILLVQNDMGQYYVPSFGVATLTEMCPGDGYSVFLSGANGIDFTYPEAGGNARSSAMLDWELYNESSASVMYANDIVKTGISHPIILTNLEGKVSEGDEVVAYADGQVVGATRVVDEDMPVVIAAWGGYENEELGISLPGYDVGDSVDLRLYSVSEGQELYVEAILEGSTYGDTPITSGTGVVLDMATPQAYELMQNYPNPFNPSTSIVFSLAETGHASLNVYDISGRLVSTLLNGTLEGGVHDIV